MKIAVQIFKDKSGTKDVLKINNAAIYSAYDVDKLLERQLNHFITKSTRTAVCFGAGLNYHQKYLNDNYPNISVLSFEFIPEIYKLLKSKKNTALTNTFFYSNSEELMFLLEKNIDYKNLESIKILNVYQSVKDFDDKYM